MKHPPPPPAMCSHSGSGGSAGRSFCCADGLIAQAETAALSANTRKTYKTGWNSWARWADASGRPVSAPTVEDILRWLVSLHMEGKKPTTLRTYLAAVAYELRGKRGTNPARDLRVRLVLAGLARDAAERGVTTRQASPLRWEHVQQVAYAAPAPRRNQPGGRLESREQAQKRADTDIAMVAVAHDAALRCAELLALTWGDFERPEGEELATIWIGRSKTDQTGEGAAVPISEYAAQALERLRPAGSDPDTRIFAFSPSTARRRIKAAAKAAGIDPAGISTHSPRVGMAQDLAASGIDLAGLMLAGRWHTPQTAAHYARRIQAQHTPAAQHLKSQTPTKTGEPEIGEVGRSTATPPRRQAA